MGTSAKNFFSNATRPNNIGPGLWAKQQAEQKVAIESFTKKSGKVLKKLGVLVSVAATAVDVGTGIYDNVQNNASFGKIAYDATVTL